MNPRQRSRYAAVGGQLYARRSKELFPLTLLGRESGSDGEECWADIDRAPVGVLLVVWSHRRPPMTRIAWRDQHKDGHGQ